MSATTAQVDSGRSGGTARAAGLMIALLLVFEFVNGVLQGTIAPMLPSIGRQLHLGAADLTWITSSELLAAAVSVPVFGRLGDLHGHRRLLRVALVAFGAGSLLVALAPTMPLMLPGRVLQGSETAIGTLIIALYRDRLPVDRARTAISWLSGTLALGVLLGSLLVGTLSAAIASAHWVLLVPGVLAALCLPLSYLPAVPESQARAAGRVDWPGAVLLALGMVLLLYGVSVAEEHSWGSAAVLGPLLLGLLVLGGWAGVEWRVPHPLVDLRETAGRSILPLLLCTFVFGVFYFTNQAAGTSFLAADPAVTGYGFKLSALGIALVTVPSVALAVVGSLLTKRAARLLRGFRWATALSFGVIGVCYTVNCLVHDSIPVFAVVQSVGGLAAGVALGAMPVMVAEAADPARTGVVMALYNNFRTLGGTVAGALAASILSAFTLTGRRTPSEHAYVLLWAVIAALCFAAAVFGALTRRTEFPRT
ncbi:MFS transporter [Phaeacidiphilus oryzae]|uniref:MFS transporter n=1 Tax=Phaeacidiphilus oryzae TaxID=348818 RepID=UPI00055D9FD1|nr:MFS transporter [Phaeacidiphilus oryzae]